MDTITSGMTQNLETEHRPTIFTQRFIAQSPAMQQLRDRLAQMAKLPTLPVLITGETGAGKEAAARELHAQTAIHTGYRKGGAFVVVNVSAVAESIFESQVFGHERGSFTGALERQTGLVEQASGGTLFLDEIIEISQINQVRLLNFLNDRRFRRVGGDKEIALDLRVIAATNGDINEAVVCGRFRSDLYYRLSAFNVEVPPLRAHIADIRVLAENFIVKINQENGTQVVPRLDQDVVQKLEGYAWPGNARELYSVIARAIMDSDGNKLTVAGIRYDTQKLIHSDLGKIQIGGDYTLEDISKAHIEAVVNRCNWRINGKGNAAERLDLHPNTLRFQMKKLGISRPLFVSQNRRSD